MNSLPNIIISLNAKEQLLKLLKINKDYSCIRFLCKSSCCGNPKIEILLDEINSEDIVTQNNDITCVYNKELTSKIKEIQLIYEDSQFMLKAIPFKLTNLKVDYSCENCSHCSKCK